MTAVAALAVAGCGLHGSTSGSDSSASQQPSASSAAATADTTSAGAPAGVTQATGPTQRAASFTLSTNSGFTGFVPSGSTTGGTHGASPIAVLAACLGGSPNAGLATDQAESTHLVNKSTGVTIWSDAQIVSAGRVEQDTNLLRDPNFTSCVTAQTKRDGVAALAASGQGAVLSPEADQRPGVPLPAGALLRTSIVVLAGLSGGGQGQIFYDTIYLGSGRVEAQLHLVGTQEPPSEDLVSVAVRQLLAKLGQ
jgi:hypothetical protein